MNFVKLLVYVEEDFPYKVRASKLLLRFSQSEDRQTELSLWQDPLILWTY